MMHLHHAPRRGAIAPITGILAIFILGMVAFSVDSGWIVLSKSELQNAADSAALAGASELMQGYVMYHLPSQDSTHKNTALNNAKAAAKQAAKDYAANNKAGQVASLVLRDADIEFGFLDNSNVYTPAPTYTGYPNTIKVKLRLDSLANQPLSLFFGNAVGTPKVDVAAIASATIYAGVVNSLKENPNQKINVLPMTFDVNDWDHFVATGRDIWDNITRDDDGNTQIRIYSAFSDKGNFGELALDDEHAGASEVRGWINHGMLASDTALLISRGLLPVSTHDRTQWDWLGNTGFKSTNVQDVNDLVGKEFLLPLFIPKVAGSSTPGYQPGIEQGSQYGYNIVRFVGIKIMPSDRGNRHINVQPSAVLEPNAVFESGTLAPVGSMADPATGSFMLTTFAAPRLTR